MFRSVPRFAHRLGLIVGAVGAAVILVSTAPALPAAPALGSIMYAGHPDAVGGSFVVVLRDGEATGSATAIAETARTLAGRYNLDLRFTYTAALKGMAVRNATEHQARQLAADPAVAYVAQDLKVSVAAAAPTLCQPVPCEQLLPGGLPPPSWHGLDRVDQRSLPLDGIYRYWATAQNVRVYVIDTGIRWSHQDFQGRAVSGADMTGGNGNDCHGHGTHVAGTIGGAIWGLAKEVGIVPVRVLDCTGSGSYSTVIAGVNWVTWNNNSSPRPSVANLSIETSSYSPLASAINNSMNANVHYLVAAGNANTDACSVTGSIPRATTVAASGPNDNRASFSNFGTCVDLYAPGVQIHSAWSTSDNAYSTISGTSMATAHVTGAAALWLERFPSSTAGQLATALTANATRNVINGNPAGTPNLLIFTGVSA